MAEQVITKEQQTQRTQAARNGLDAIPRTPPPESGPVQRPPGVLRRGYTTGRSPTVPPR